MNHTVYVAHPLWWLLGFFALVVVTQIAGAVRRSRARRAALAALGFREVPAQGFFTSASTDGADLFDRHAYDVETFNPGIYGSIAVGATRLGEAALFDYSFRRSNRPSVTVVAFHAPRALPAFRLHHVLLGDRISRWLAQKAQPASSARAATPQMRAQLVIGPGGVQLEHPTPVKPAVALDEDPEFAERYVVRSGDAAGVRRVLTPAARAALVALDDGNLTIEKGGDWLFFYLDARTARPDEYAAILDGAVRIVGLMDLGAADAA